MLAELLQDVVRHVRTTGRDVAERRAQAVHFVQTERFTRALTSDEPDTVLV